MYEIHIIEIKTGKTVKKLSYETKRLAEKALIGVLNRIDLEEFTADCMELKS